MLSALKAGSAEITVTVTYWGQNFTATVNVTVNAAEIPIDYSVGKLFQNGAEITANEDGALVPDATAEVKTLTFDTYATKSGMGYRRIRFTVKFNALTNDHVNVPGAGPYSFGYTYGNVSVGWYNSYTNGSKYEGAYVGAFTGGSTSPNANAYLRIYNADGKMIFEHYDKTGWSSSYYGYIPELVTGTEYTFDIDTEKTGDITLYGFENAVFTEIEWVDYNKVEIAFDKDSVTSADEWEWFGISATTSDDLAKLTFSSDNEEVLVVKGTRAIGVKAGTANILAKNSAGKTVKLAVTINENAENRPVLELTNTETELDVYDYIEVEYTFKAKGEDISASDYTVGVTFDAEDIMAANGMLIAALKAGNVKVTLTVVYSGIEFKKELSLTVNEPATTVDPAKGKLYNNGVALTPVDGQYAADSANTNLTFDKAAYKAALGYTKVRFTVKFGEFVSNSIRGSYEFGFTYKGIYVLFDNDYSQGMYAGAFLGESDAPTQYGYVRIYDSTGVYFEHYTCADWSSSGLGCGYKPALVKDTEYTFEVDIAKTGDISLLGFETATFTKIEWVA